MHCVRLFAVAALAVSFGVPIADAQTRRPEAAQAPGQHHARLQRSSPAPVSGAARPAPSGRHARLDARLTDTARLESSPRVIVSYQPGAGPRVRQRLRTRARIGRDHASFDAVSLRISKTDLDWLASDPD
ncbi:MAG TPA: hypothetical protein VNI78_06085, partial [Vicinamibacterales bacterium]|nr:hypothetical protein [Vicinamibacterales bacterium]